MSVNSKSRCLEFNPWSIRGKIKHRGVIFGGVDIERQTTEALVRAYLAIQQIIEDLYAEADNAASSSKYNDASFLTSQAEILYQVAENMETVIAEHSEEEQ